LSFINRHSPIIALPLLALFSPACSSTPASTQTGTTAAADTTGAEDMSETESNIETLGVSFVGSDGQSVAMASVAATAAGDPGFFFQPVGCIQVTANAAMQQATYVFTGCTGPLGLDHLNGTITVGWQLELAPVSLTVTYATQNFQINGSTITSWQATAVITNPVSTVVDAGINVPELDANLLDVDASLPVLDASLPSVDAGVSAREMTWSAILAGTTAGGREFQRTTKKDLKWTVGQPCLSVTGVSDGTIAGANIKTTITSFDRCESACPQAGSELQVSNLDSGDSITVLYSGGPAALLTINGKSGTIALACGS
jgi:hypothetical protein